MHKFRYPFLLASGSEFRKNLLGQVGIKPDLIISPDIDESNFKNELPPLYCKRIAITKAQHAQELYQTHLILAADTVVCAGRRILHKTNDENLARSYLKLLSGRRHSVITTLCVISPCGKKHIKQSVNKVKFKRLHNDEIEQYLTLDEWKKCAGAYTISGHAAQFISFISGSYSSIVGLPLFETMQVLKQYYL